MPEYQFRLKRSENKVTLRHVTNEFKLQHVGRQGIKGDKGDPGDPASNLVTSVNGRQGAVVGLAEQAAVDAAFILKANAADLGTAAASNVEDFATADQGVKSDTAIQTIQSGDGITIDDSDPQNPVIYRDNPTVASAESIGGGAAVYKDNQFANLTFRSLVSDDGSVVVTQNADEIDFSVVEYVTQAVSNLVDSSPTTLDTLNELAAALGDDPNYAATTTALIGNKLSKAGDTMTGTLGTQSLNPSINLTYELGSTNYYTQARVRRIWFNSTMNIDGAGGGTYLDVSGALVMTSVATPTILRFTSANEFSSGLTVQKRGATSGINDAPKDGAEIGYHSFLGWDGVSAYKRLAYVIVRANGDTTPSAGGGIYHIVTRNSINSEGVRVTVDGVGLKAGGNLAYDLGIPSVYWNNMYSRTVYFNSTALINGSTAGRMVMTGTLDIGGYGASLLAAAPPLLMKSDTNNISGIEMTNINAGVAADFRFLIRDPTGHYLAFSQPGVGNTESLFGYTRSTVDLIFGNGGTGRHLVVGTVTANDLVLGTNGSPRIFIRSSNNGLVGVGVPVPTAAVDIAASSLARSSFRLRSGVEPTAPNDGDIWFDGLDLRIRVGGVTKTFTLT